MFKSSRKAKWQKYFDADLFDPRGDSFCPRSISRSSGSSLLIFELLMGANSGKSRSLGQSSQTGMSLPKSRTPI